MEIYDGCSGGMSWAWRKLFKKPPPWEGCCDAHDQPYARGGSKLMRRCADYDLYACITKRGYEVWAIVVYWGVRVGGVPWLPTPWRWGFKTKLYSYKEYLGDIN